MCEAGCSTGVTDHQLLVLAYGNPLRSDDGAGLALASELPTFLRAAGHSVRLLCVQQLMPELALAIAEPDVVAVLFVDTRMMTATEPQDPQIQIQSIDAAQLTASVTHHLGPQLLLLYASKLYHHAPPSWLVTIPGSDFGHGTTLSPQVQRM